MNDDPRSLAPKNTRDRLAIACLSLASAGVVVVIGFAIAGAPGAAYTAVATVAAAAAAALAGYFRGGRDERDEHDD